MNKWLIIFLLLTANVSLANDTNEEIIILPPSGIDRVYDGDTFFINLSLLTPIFGDSLPIRAKGYDTPEIRSYCDTEEQKASERALGHKAREKVTELFNNAKVIALKDLERGKYFRVLATVYVDGEPLGTLLIDNDLAVPYDGGTRYNWCDKVVM